MTAEEKAKELIYWAWTYGASKEVSRLFADKICDEILKEIGRSVKIENHSGFNIYWNRVKEELEKI